MQALAVVSVAEIPLEAVLARHAFKQVQPQVWRRGRRHGEAPGVSGPERAAWPRATEAISKVRPSTSHGAAATSGQGACTAVSRITSSDLRRLVAPFAP